VRYALLSALNLAVLLIAAPAFARVPADVPVPKGRPGDHVAASEPAKPTPGRHPSLTDIPDMSKAVPASQIGKLPTTEERYQALKTKVDAARPHVEKARKTSEALKAETAQLRRQLIETASRVQWLEQEKSRLDIQIANLKAKEKSLSASFAHDRVAVSHLLGLLERLQHDMPPVLALTADDALNASRSAMLLGASLPRVYGQAAQLAKRLKALRRTRKELVARRIESARNAVRLSAARAHLDQLLATKEKEADSAAAQYTKLAAKFSVIARQTKDLGQLLHRVAALRAQNAGKSSVRSLGGGWGGEARLTRGSLRWPVAGRIRRGGNTSVGGARAPGVTFLTVPGAQVVAPADAKILFAGRYHMAGQVLILEMAGGYDLVLAGLGHVDVSMGDRVLAGEPLGTLPKSGGARTGREGQLYFEVRHDRKGMSPAPWLETGLRKAEKS
jgi:septal ring factor EnvC (AmiA/AmiB activator)